ncbi:MAG: hypothetical protein ABSF90_08955 [Syntrophobacteraceae bacterium]|jgi:hypothetical protein
MKEPFYILGYVPIPERRNKKYKVVIKAANAIREKEIDCIDKAVKDYIDEHIEVYGLQKRDFLETMKDFRKSIIKELKSGPQNANVTNALSTRIMRNKQSKEI